MIDEKPSFNAAPISDDESEAVALLWQHPRAEDFANGLSRERDGWAVTWLHHDQPVVLKALSLRSLAVAFVEWTPEREAARKVQEQNERAAKLKAEADRQAAARAEQERKSLLTRTLMGGGA